jgi:hypothetical protein
MLTFGAPPFILWSMNKNLTSQDWDLLTQFLPTGWEDKAKQLGALRRNRNFKSAAELLRLLLIHLADGCSLRETVVRARQGGLTSLSDVALLKRLRASSEWLRWMTLELLQHQARFASPLTGLSDFDVKSVDATVISEPGSTGTDWRIHYSLRLSDLQCDQFILSRQDKGESFTNFQVHPGDLLIADRAYGTAKGLKHVRQHDGHFLVRLRNKAFKFYGDNGQEVDLLREVQSLAIGEIWEQQANTVDAHDGANLELRLIAVRKSDDKAEESVQRTLREQTKKQRSVDPQTLMLQRYVILASSLPATYSARQLLELYRSRWQIEIAFKRLKSIMGLGCLPKTDLESCRAWLYGKLFVAQFTQTIMDEGRHFSPWGYPIGTGRLSMARDIVRQSSATAGDQP